MNSSLVHFSKFIGNKVLYKNQELTLHAVGLGFIFCINGNLDFISLPIEECRIILENQNEYIKYQVPSKLVVFKTETGEYKQADELGLKNDTEKEIDIINTICKCAGTTLQDLRKNYKKRKKELVQARQVHMVIRHLIINKNESLSQIGALYNKDHATVLHAKKAVLNALDGYNIEFRERFREAFEMTLSYYPDTAYKKLNLTWL